VKEGPGRPVGTQEGTEKGQQEDKGEMRPGEVEGCRHPHEGGVLEHHSEGEEGAY